MLKKDVYECYAKDLVSCEKTMMTQNDKMIREWTLFSKIVHQKENQIFPIHVNYISEHFYVV